MTNLTLTAKTCAFPFYLPLPTYSEPTNNPFTQVPFHSEDEQEVKQVPFKVRLSAELGIPYAIMFSL